MKRVETGFKPVSTSDADFLQEAVFTRIRVLGFS